MSKTLWVPVKSSLEKYKDGKFPECTGKDTGEKVTFYADYNEAANTLMNPEHAVLNAPPVAGGQQILQPPVCALYQVELSDVQLTSLVNVTPAFSAGQYRGTLDPTTISEVSTAIGTDFLHYESEFVTETIPEGRTPQHLDALTITKERYNSLNALAETIKKSSPGSREKVDLSDPVTQRALVDVYAAEGFLNDETVRGASQYVRSYTRMMVKNAPIDTVAKASAFHEAFNANLEKLEAQHRKASTMELETQAMESTIQEFQAQANTTHNLIEQKIFGEMLLSVESDRAEFTPSPIDCDLDASDELSWE